MFGSDPFGKSTSQSFGAPFAKTFTKHLRAMAVMGGSGALALIVGVILFITVGWQAGLLAFVIIAVVGGAVGLLMALRNMGSATKIFDDF